MMEKTGFVYILASKRNGTIYIGVTSDLPSRSISTSSARSAASPEDMGARPWSDTRRSTSSTRRATVSFK
jgi:hypothetical protein